MVETHAQIKSHICSNKVMTHFSWSTCAKKITKDVVYWSEYKNTKIFGPSSSATKVEYKNIHDRFYKDFGTPMRITHLQLKYKKGNKIQKKR